MLKKLIEATTKSEEPYLPNKFTVAQGKLIQEARKEAKMTQEELAEATYLRQMSISRIEKGTRSISTEELLYLSYTLNKPISYFFPEDFRTKLDESELSEIEKEMLTQVRQLSQSDLRKLIAQARALAELSDEDEPEPKKSPKHQEEFKKLVEQAAKKKNKVS
jgi:transcriptional regulator with XRE-family HTH domain